jgi:eukaryotic-like serine/threonine-protein kinase
MPIGGIFQFGEFQIDAGARTLRREKAIVTLNSRTFDVLLYLVQKPGRVLARDELLKNIWADAFVDEHSLAQSISVLRRALDEKPGENSYIVTLPGRGYQFVAPVRAVNPEVGNVEQPIPVATSDSSGIIFQKHTIHTSVVTTNANNKEQLSSPGSRSRVARIIAPVAIAATLVVSAILGSTWYWRSHQAPKLTEKDTIVVADFENRTGDPVFNDTLKDALAVDLDQSPYLNVVSDQKISEGLKLMGRDTRERLTGEVAHDLCQRLSSNALLQGSIANLGNQYIVVLTVTNCATGDTLTSEQVRAESKEKILPAVDKAASSLRGKLGESLSSAAKYDTPVEQATTPSLAALEAYSEGVKVWANKGSEAAIPFYKRAIELDPSFAMAYAHLGQAYANLGVSGGSENLKKAFMLRDGLSERERFYIDSRYYDIVTGDKEKTIRILEEWRQTYPRESGPARALVLHYGELGRYEDALREARESVRLEPTDLNYNEFVFSALKLNRLDEAQSALNQWQGRSPDSPMQVWNLYFLAFLRGDPVAMQKQSARGVGPDWGNDFLWDQSNTEAYYGRIRKAREFTHREMKSVVGDKENAGLHTAWCEIDGALHEVLLGYTEQAKHDVTAALNLSRDDVIQIHAALALALAGDTRRRDYYRRAGKAISAGHN